MYREGERPGKKQSYFNELAHVSLEVGMTEIYRAGRQRLGTQEGTALQVHLGAIWSRIPSSSGTSVFS